VEEAIRSFFSLPPFSTKPPATNTPPQTGPVYLTPTELLAYDGTDPTKPIYLAINGSIYDVSANARTYGPGGSYHYFAGCDAARAYVTGCFAEDRTPDMRGVEDMYLPLDDPAVDRHWSKAELEALKQQERAAAEKRVHEGLVHWVNFFRDSPKYDFVGYVKQPEGWPGTEPMRPLCASAAKGRKKRVVPGTGKDGKDGK
jgi:predicted heme/steroid binding protein